MYTLATGLHLLTDILKDVDNEEGRDEIVDALYVTAGGMPDGPDEKNPLKDLKEKGKSTIYINKNMTYGYNCRIHAHRFNWEPQRTDSCKHAKLWDFAQGHIWLLLIRHTDSISSFSQQSIKKIN